MTCRHVLQLQDAFLDGTLSASMIAEVHAHLLQCPACQQEIEVLRAAGDVIAKDTSEPMLDSGFASRVVGALQIQQARPNVSIETRLQRHQRVRRLMLGSSLPALAAALFLAVLIWPTPDRIPSPTYVEGDSVINPVAATGVDQMVNPTLSTVADTRKAASSLNRLLDISVDQARRDVETSLEESVPQGIPFVDILLNPFTEILRPSPKPAPARSADGEVVRF